MEPTDSTAATPRDQAQQKENEQQLHEAIMALPDDLRETVLLHYADGMSASEIARLTGEAPSTITRRLSRSHDRLRDFLKGTDPRPLAGMRPAESSTHKALALLAAASALPAASRAELLSAISDTPIPPASSPQIHPAAQATPTETTAMKSFGAKLGFTKIAAVLLITAAAIGGGTYLQNSLQSNTETDSNSGEPSSTNTRIIRTANYENPASDSLIKSGSHAPIDRKKSLPRTHRRRAISAEAASATNTNPANAETTNTQQNTAAASPTTSASIATITGTIRDKLTSQPIPNALVRAALGAPEMRSIREELNKKTFPETHTDFAGRYTFELPLTDGATSVALDAFSPGYRSLAGTFMSGGDFTAAHIQVSPGQTISKDLMLPAAMYVAAHVVDESGKPLRNVQVKATIDLQRGMAFIANTVTDNNGEFQIFDFPLPNEKADYRITAGVIELKRDDLVTTHVKDVYSITESQRQNLKIVMNSGSQLNGQLLTAAGEPATSVPLHIQYGPELRRERRDVVTDQTGYFELQGLPSGSASLYARAMKLHQVMRAEIDIPTSNALTLQMVPIPPVNTADAVHLLGMTLINNTPELTKAYDLYSTTGVFVMDAGTAPSKFRGLEQSSQISLAEGSLIFFVGDKRISNLRDLATEVLRVNSMEKPAKFINEGHKGYVRFAFSCPKEFGNGSNTQYMDLTPQDIADLETYLASHPPPPNQ